MSQEKSECLYYDCKRKPLGRSKEGYCIFHTKAEEKDEREFNEALESYISEIRAKDLDYNFNGFVFVGDINFEGDFKVRVFKNTNFVGAEFGGRVYFWAAEFRKGALFMGTIFRGDAYFVGAKFQKYAFFEEARFLGKADFEEARFLGKADFAEAEFRKGAVFMGAEFEGYACFEGAEFRGGANFQGVELRARASISPRFTKGEVLFIHASLENIYLTPLNFDKGARIDFSGARLRNTEIRRKDIECHIMQEREEHFSEAKEIYLLLKNNFHSLGRYDDESWAFRKEKEMERRSFWHFRKEYKERELGEKWSNKGVKFCFYAALLDFEYPAKYLQDHWFPSSRKKTKRLLSHMVNFLQDPIASVKGEFKNFASFVVKNKQNKIGNFSRKELSRVLWFYMKYPMKCFWSTFLKYLYEWGECPWLIFFWCAVTIFIFSVLYLRWDIIAKDGTLARSYLDKLYFSGVTFTTLGYGDYSPVGGARFLAFLESFLGVLLIALFIFSFARRTAGR